MSFLTAHLGYEIPSPAILEKIGTAFRRAVPRTTGSRARDTTRGPIIASPHLGHRRRPSERRAMGIERRTVHRLIARAAGPGVVAAEAGLLSDEHLPGAESW